MIIPLESKFAENLIKSKLQSVQIALAKILTEWNQDNPENFIEKARSGELSEAEMDAIIVRQFIREIEKLESLLKVIKEGNKMRQIGIIGSGTVINDEIRRIAEGVGKELAKRSVILICGGKGGVMEAACRGVQNFSGISVGILPSISPAEANKYVMIKIPTNLGEERNYLIIQSAQAVICISGALGTRMEAEYALKCGVPLVTIPPSGGTSRKMAEEFPDRVIIAKNAQEAVEKAIQAI